MNEVLIDIPFDLAKAEQAFRTLLEAFHIDINKESLRDTPRRAALAYSELFTAQPFKLTTFPNEHHYDELVMVRSIQFHSVCEHHLLPFFGVAHIGYLPKDRIIGLSKLARLVEFFARRPQVQENLTAQIANWLHDNLKPKGVGVILEAEHLCMSIRGVKRPGAKTVTSVLKGCLRENAQSRQEFLSLARENNSK
jgi:GTP cyclohydrolase I